MLADFLNRAKIDQRKSAKVFRVYLRENKTAPADLRRFFDENRNRSAGIFGKKEIDFPRIFTPSEEISPNVEMTPQRLALTAQSLASTAQKQVHHPHLRSCKAFRL
jgi:hypothetical protein